MSTQPRDMPPLPLPIPAEVADALRAWHAEVDWGCAAHWDGKSCCLDHLLGT